MSNDAQTDVIDYHSMDSVLQRLNKITNFINYHRSKGSYKLMHSYLIDYFKEIYADLTKDERDDGWKRLMDVKKYLNANSQFPIHHKAPQMLDEIDLNQRLLAKIHGYLTQTKKKLDTKITS